MKIWIVSQANPGDVEPHEPHVFTSSDAAEGYVEGILREAWKMIGTVDRDGNDDPYPGNWRAAQEAIAKDQHWADLGSRFGCYAITCHEIAMPELLIGVFTEGGIVQSVTTDDPARAQHITVVTVDYDTEGAEPEDMTPVPQDDGEPEPGFVYGHNFKGDAPCTIIAGALANKRADITWADHEDKEG